MTLTLSTALKDVTYSILSSVWAVKTEGNSFTTFSKAMIVNHVPDEPLQNIPLEYSLVCDGLYPYEQYYQWINDTKDDSDYSWETFEKILICKFNTGISMSN